VKRTFPQTMSVLHLNYLLDYFKVCCKEFFEQKLIVIEKIGKRNSILFSHG